MTYEVQHYTICHGWVNTWHYTDNTGALVPETFETAEAAEAALAEYFADLESEVAAGNLTGPYDPEEFRIRRIGAPDRDGP